MEKQVAIVCLLVALAPDAILAATVRIVNRRPTHHVILDINTGIEKTGTAMPEYAPGKKCVRSIGQSFALLCDSINVEITDITLKLNYRCNFAGYDSTLTIAFLEDTNGDRLGDVQIAPTEVANLNGLKANKGQYITFILSTPVTLIPGRFYTVEFWHGEEAASMTGRNQLRLMRTADKSVYEPGNLLVTQGQHMKARQFPFGQAMFDIVQQDLDLVLCGRRSHETRAVPISRAELDLLKHPQKPTTEPQENNHTTINIQVLKDRPQDNLLLNIEPTPPQPFEDKGTYTPIIGQTFIIESESPQIEISDITVRLAQEIHRSNAQRKYTITFKEDLDGDKIGDFDAGVTGAADLSELTAPAGSFLNFSFETPITLLANRTYSFELRHITTSNEEPQQTPLKLLISRDYDAYSNGFYLTTCLERRVAPRPDGTHPVFSYMAHDLDLVLRGRPLFFETATPKIQAKADGLSFRWSICIYAAIGLAFTTIAYIQANRSTNKKTGSK